MVVGDDDVDPVLYHLFDLLRSRNAAIDRDEQGAVPLKRKLQGVADEAFFQHGPIGNVKIHFSADFAEKLGQKGGGGHAVHIVIAINQDRLLLSDGDQDPVDRFIHIGKEIGVEKIRQLGVEKFVDF